MGTFDRVMGRHAPGRGLGSVTPAPDPLAQVVHAVLAAGGNAYLVGGAVRDPMLGLTSKDRDILVTKLAIDQLAKVLPGRVDVVGKSFGVVKVTLGGETIDVALPRTERSTGAGHRDFVVQADPFLPVEADLGRRDFTMNAIAFNLASKQTVDPYGGIRDLRAKVIRAVGDPAARFDEDPLRMLRATRFMAKLNFEIEPATARAIKLHAPRLKSVSVERMADELMRTLSYPDADGVLRALRAMRDLGTLEQVIPEFKATYRFEQHNSYHRYTVDEHIFHAVHHVVAHQGTPRARLATLLHDIAKPTTFTLDEKGSGHFYGHEDAGGEMARIILNRLKMPIDLVDSVALIVKEHLRPPHDPSDKVLRRYVVDMGEALDDALMCREGDIAAHASGIAAQAHTMMDRLRSRIADLAALRGFSQAKLALRGDEMMRVFGLTQAQGKEIGRLKNLATQAVIDNLVPNEREALIGYLRPFLNKAG